MIIILFKGEFFVKNKLPTIFILHIPLVIIYIVFNRFLVLRVYVKVFIRNCFNSRFWIYEIFTVFVFFIFSFLNRKVEVNTSFLRHYRHSMISFFYLFWSIKSYTWNDSAKIRLLWWIFLFFLNDFLLNQGWVFLLLLKVYWVTEFFQGVIDWRLSLGNSHLDYLVEYHLALILISGLAQIIYQFFEILLLHAFNLLLNCIGYSLLIKKSNLNADTFGDQFLILPFDENVIKMIKINGC